MKKNSKRDNIPKIVALLGMFLIVFGISYALFTITLNGTKKNKISTATLSLELLDMNYNPIYEEATTGTIQSGYAINIENMVPMTYEQGMTQQSFDFIVKNNGTIPAHYDLKLIDGENNTLDRKYIRYVLTQSDYNLKADNTYYNGGFNSNEIYGDEYLSTKPYRYKYNITGPLLSSIENNNLDNTTIFPGEEIHYTLKLWLDYAAGDNPEDDVMGKLYEATIKLEGTQAKEYYSSKAGDNVDYTIYSDGTLYVSGTGNMGTGLVYDGQTPITYGGGPIADFIFGSIGQSLTGQTITNGLALKVDYVGYGSKFLSNTDWITTFATNMQKFYNCANDLSDDPECTEGVKSLLKNINLFMEAPELGRIVVGEGVTSISDYAFYAARGKMITIPSTVTDIGKGAFDETRTYKIIIPEGVTELQTSAVATNFVIRPGERLALKELVIPSTVNSAATSSVYVAYRTHITINKPQADVESQWHPKWLYKIDNGEESEVVIDYAD